MKVTLTFYNLHKSLFKLSPLPFYHFNQHKPTNMNPFNFYLINYNCASRLHDASAKEILLNTCLLLILKYCDFAREFSCLDVNSFDLS